MLRNSWVAKLKFAQKGLWWCAVTSVNATKRLYNINSYNTVTNEATQQLMDLASDNKF